MKTARGWRYGSMGVAGLLLWFSATVGGGARPLTAQELTEELVQCFAEAQATNSLGCAEGPEPHWSGVLLAPDAYPEPLVEGVLAGLAQLGRSGEDARFRVAAISWLGSVVGLQHARTSAIEHLTDIYGTRPVTGEGEILIREIIIEAMSQAARRETAVAFLESLVMEGGQAAGGAREWSPSGKVISALLRMDAPGRAALQRLHANSAGLDLQARYLLDELAERGFRKPSGG